MKRLWRHILLATCATLCALVAAAQPAAGDTVRVRLVTFYPGSEVFEVYGHTELRVTQGRADYYFNYGVFDFASPGFTWRFVLGHTDYMCVAIPPKLAMMDSEGRRMVEQELNLTQEQAIAVRDMLIENAQPENMVYRYQYFSDNCSTRPRDIVERALGDSLRYAELADGHTTFRDIVSHYSAHYPWSLLGIDLALGSALDRPVTSRERMFVPMLLMEAMDSAVIVRDGKEVPAVRLSERLIDGSEQGLVLPATPWWRTPMAVAVALLLVVAALSVRDLHRKRMSRALDTTLYTFYGLLGCLLLFLATISTHEGTWPNYNLLWLHPLYLLAAVTPWIATLRRHRRLVHGTLLALLIATALLWPWLPQVANPTFFVMMAIVAIRSAAHFCTPKMAGY